MTQFTETYQPENGAKSGPKRAKKMRDALMVALEREIEVEGKLTKRGMQIAEALAKKAAEGDVQAAREIFDRIDGKPAQTITGEDGGAIALSLIQRIVVDPNAKN
jgi:hypothetical protein